MREFTAPDQDHEVRVPPLVLCVVGGITRFLAGLVSRERRERS
jgi:hypothetical protein